MAGLTILDLVANNTLSARIAATLWIAMDARLSFLVVAEPRFAGKSTLMRAVLALLSSDVPRHYLDGSEEQMRQLKREARGGYLIVEEIGQADQPGYIWGEAVGTLFETLTAGYSLASALHAGDLNETFDVLCRHNDLSDGAASRVVLVLQLRRFGDAQESFWRRLAEVNEVDGVSGGRPDGILLHRWRQSDDSFEVVQPPRRLAADLEQLDSRADSIATLVRSGRTGADALAELILRFPAGS